MTWGDTFLYAPPRRPVQGDDMSDWRDITTAPKDGTEILVARGRQMGVVFWRWERWNLGVPAAYFDKPTHWQPLPSVIDQETT